MLTHSLVCDEDATATMAPVQWFLVGLRGSWAVGAAATVLPASLHCWCRPCAYFECSPPQPSTPNFLSWFIVTWTIDDELIDSVQPQVNAHQRAAFLGVFCWVAYCLQSLHRHGGSLFQGSGGIFILSFVLKGANVTLGNWALLTWY